MRYAVQILRDQTGAPRARQSTRGNIWETVAVAGRLVTAERVLCRVRTDWANKSSLIRIKPFTGPAAQAYSLAEG